MPSFFQQLDRGQQNQDRFRLQGFPTPSSDTVNPTAPASRSVPSGAGVAPPTQGMPNARPVPMPKRNNMSRQQSGPRQQLGG